MRLLGATVALTWVLATTAAAQATKFEKADAEARPKIQAIWIETLKKAAELKSTNVARRAANEASFFGAAGDAFDAQYAEAEALEHQPEEKEAPEALAAEADAKKRVAALLEPYVLPEPPAAALSRWCDLAVRTLEAEPKSAKLLAAFQKKVGALIGAKDWTHAAALVKRAAELDPAGYKAGKYAAAEQALLKNDRLLIRARTHWMQGYVALPADWSAKKTWPMIVSVVGANCAYEQVFDDLRKATAKTPYIAVVAMTISNANDLPYNHVPYAKVMMKKYEPLQSRPDRIWFDENGLPGLVAEVRARFNGTEKFFMTGYSGGGFLTHFWLRHHPDQLLGVGGGSMNYWDFQERDAVPTPEGGVPVTLFTGSVDQAGKERIFPQNDEALTKLKAAGFTDVTRTHLTGRDHEPFFVEAIEFFDKVRARAAKPAKAK